MPTQQQTAIVTGAASGMGRAMAIALQGAGFDVLAVDRNQAGLATLPQGIRGLAADLSDPRAPDAITAEALKPHGRIDVLVNNAGIGQASIRADQRRNPLRFWETTAEQWQRFLAVNASGAINLTRAVVSHMLTAGSGRIVTVTTSLGTMVREGYLLYGASKAACEAAMASLAADLNGTGVTSNILVPGGVTDTPLVGEGGDRARMLRPEIMNPPLLWLVSPEAADVNARRFIAADWDTTLPASEAAARAGAPIAWLSIARMPIEPT